MGEFNFSTTLVQHGYVGTSPQHPNSAIAINVLELFRVLSARCASLSIQAFVRALAEMHQVK